MLSDYHRTAAVLAGVGLFGLVIGDYALGLFAAVVGVLAYWVAEQLRRRE